MSESEEDENFCFFGKPLQPYDEDSFPKKKPIALEDQIATDQQGRRRFHGAFTGGFSAGFYNTVGSLEGWTPREFKSTRQDKATGRSQMPEDFMDDEDIGQFGIAPQTVRATKDYATTKKRKRQMFNEGPIPGEPVLHSLLSSGNETIGYLLLKNIGFKDKDKVKAQHDIVETAEQKIYGCEMPRNYEISRHEEVVQYSIPDIYKEFLAKPKDNTFGLGYVGLDKSHLNLFQPKSLVINEKNKKKLSITGQAFGVGAFEDDDEDIYVKDDMSRYDFELTSEKATKTDPLKKKEEIYLEDFVRSKNILHPNPVFLPPKIPQSFIGKHKVKKSRFEPLEPPERTPRIPERKDMNPDIRAQQLGEMPSTSAQIVPPKEIKKEVIEEDSICKEIENKTYDILSASGLIFDRFVSASKPEDPSNILEVVEKSHTTHGTQEMRDAAKLKMFGPLTRITTDWQPCSLLCKRFNVPEPHFDELSATKKKRTKNLIFEYQKFNEDLPELKPGLTIQTTPVEEEKDENTDENMESTQLTEIATENDAVVEEPSVATKLEDSTPKEVHPLPKDITEKIDVEENIDMFKAIFLSSSSESENEEEEEKRSKTEETSLISRNEEMRANILSDDNFIPKIKPIKEGILSNMDFSVFTTKSKEVDFEVQEEIEVADDDAYGPRLPQKSGSSSSNNVAVPKSSKNADDSSNDEWVEKGQEQGRKDHKKKHKKHKKKHKHHKKKH